MIKAVLFDFDGVVINTLEHHFQAWEYLFGQRGATISRQTVIDNEGRNSREMIAILQRESGLSIREQDYDDFINRKRAIYRAIDDAKPYPGVFETIDELWIRGYRIGLVTGNSITTVRHSLNEIQLAAFDTIVTSEDVHLSKPNPASYILAMGRLQVRYNECLVVENSVLGLRAAHNANMACCAIMTTNPPEKLLIADFIYSDIKELLQCPAIAQ